MIRTILIYFFFASLYATTSFADAIVTTNSLNEFNRDFQSMCDYQEFSGAVLLAIDDKIVFERACGFANRNFNVPNTIDTKFNLGSVSKIFTSVAIAQLIGQNKLSLSTSIQKITPSWLPEELAKKITIGQLLIHTSGLGNYIEDSDWKLKSNSNLYTNTSDFRDLIYDSKLLFTPGTSQYYSNNGYILLGAVIETLSQQNYINYLKKSIFEPAAMNNTDLFRLDEPTLNRADGYMYQCSKGKCLWKSNYFQANFIGNAAGGAYSTVGDLFKFSHALHNNMLLTPELTKEVLSDRIITPSNDIDVYIAIKPLKLNNLEIPVDFSSYGFAGAWNKFGLAAWEQPSFLGQTGGMAGASAFFATSPEGKYTVIILSNVSGSGSILLYKRIRALLGLSADIMNF